MVIIGMKKRKLIIKKHDERIKYSFIANIEAAHRFLDKAEKEADLKRGYRIRYGD